MLHYEKVETNAEFPDKALEEKLRKHIGEFNKKNLKKEHYVDRIDTAIENAGYLDAKRSERWPNKTGTHVYRVVQAIRELTR